MSYDIYFLSRRDGQSWDDALEAMEDSVEDSKPIPARLGHRHRPVRLR
ncbi:hypothetical protein ACH40E_34435 [Streptomyces acidicola]